tara:strand:- start:642 stop:836 length:195 start_codon:yes stop_codon:yes gene_type:complete
MSQCGVCNIHNEIYLADENEYYEKKYDTNTAIWSAEEVYEDYNLEIKENGICECCLYNKYGKGE